jgi:chaperonin GroEL
MDKISIIGGDVRKQLKSGTDKLVNPVKITLGAKGRLVGLYDSIQRKLHVTKDGYTIAKNFKFESNKVETIAIEMVQQAINNTNSVVGDATTTTAIMCQSLVSVGLELVEAGANPLELKLGMEDGLEFVKKEIQKMQSPVKDSIEKIATISGNNRKDVGENISKAFDVAGRDENSSIKVLITTDEKTEIEEVSGYKLEKGFLRDSFINHPSRTKCVYENPYIVMVHSTLTSFRDFLPLLRQSAEKQRPLVIIADKFEGEFLNSLEVTLNQQLVQLERAGSGYFQQIGVVQNPMGFQSAKELYDDMAIVTGSKSSSLSVIINDINIDDLGSADSIEIDRTKTLIIGGKGSKAKVKEKIKQLNAQLKSDKDLTPFMKDVIRERIESLSGSHANIRVGGKNQTEIKELKDLYDDALNAVRASIKEGVVPGGGAAMLHIANKMRSKKTQYKKGWELIIQAIEQPFYQIMYNARENNAEDIAQEILKRPINTGYNVLTREYVNMIDEGIIDPAMAERVALENAVAVAVMMYNMDGVVVEDLS